ncbi:CoA transferase [Actinomadura sp. NBRC 104425]|uniref:CaiB/BaiF CoA transferase family protein n=1 Tax=Actinomadura sp. NBRC 104425 TaxID=3032204 RepID=UPI00249FB4C1|nr:CaiB/BaiF CoA-transferase family protein [Actinomadura sp. NBRC 104425]GLZ15790.1 CoA transferase [Actinomadura sp. NBRC 104425]
MTDPVPPDPAGPDAGHDPDAAGGPAPAGSAQRGPLDGVRVIELGGIGPAPFAGMLLADLGADVVRVDRPADRGRVPSDGSQILHRGKRSICLDLKNPADTALFLRLAAKADVVIEASRPGVAERLGVGPDDVLAVNPRIVYGRMTGWGQTGPKAKTAGHDVGYIAGTGLLHAIGDKSTPQIPLALVGDFGGGALYLVVGVLAALHTAQRSGTGQVVDAAIVDGAAHLGTLVYGMLAAGHWRDERQSNLMDGGTPFYALYETSDNKHMAVGPLEPKFYDEFINLLAPGDELPSRGDQAAWPALREQIAARFRTRTRDEWTAVFAGSDACVEPVLSLEEALEDEHLMARGTFVDLGGVRQPAPAPRFSRTPDSIASPPCVPGEHAHEVLADWGVESAADQARATSWT